MDILTKPQTIVKGTPALFTIDKVGLVSLYPVASDSYFSNSQNWSRIYLMYKSSVGRQSETVAFDARKVSPSAYFDVSARARDNFFLDYILIFDFDNASLAISRSEIPNATDFDVTMTNP